MRLLFVCPQVPWPLVSGARLRIYHQLAAASQQHEVDLLAFGARPDTLVAPPELQGLCRRTVIVPAPPPRHLAARALGTVASPLPDLANRLWSPRLLAALRSLLAHESYNAVQAFGLEMGRYLSAARHAKTIQDEANVEFQLQAGAARVDVSRPRSWLAAAYSRVQATKLRRFETSVCRGADLVLGVSSQDIATLRTLAPRTAMHVVPNGVDTAAFPYREPPPSVEPNLLFTGSLDYRPNADAALWFCQDVLPLVKAVAPGVRFFAVGHGPRPALIDVGKQDRAVAVTGAVADIAPYWDLAAVYVLPMRMGGGVRFKAMEALSLGLPLVSTALGMQGLDAEPGRHFLLADTPVELADAIQRLLSDHALRLRLARAGRELAERRYDWRHVAPRLLGAYAELEQRPRTLHKIH